MSADKLPELFKDFSSSEDGGLGLQLVYHLTHNRGGFVELQTKRAGEQNPITYNTRDGIADVTNSEFGRLPAEWSTGTCFSVYVPR